MNYAVIENKEMTKDYFYDELYSFIKENLQRFRPISSYSPLPERKNLEVDVCFDVTPKKLFLFGVENNEKAILVSNILLGLLQNYIPFRSITVYRDFNEIPSVERNTLINVGDKQFTNLSEFEKRIVCYLRRETKYAIYE